MKTDPDCIFCKLVAGDVPAHKIYEDDKTIAFLDLKPVNEGHSLVIPKTHAVQWQEVEGDAYTDYMQTLRKVARRVKEVIGSPHVNIVTHGFDIPHAHIHVLPVYKPSDMHGEAFAKAAQQEVDHEALAKTAEKLKFE